MKIFWWWQVQKNVSTWSFMGDQTGSLSLSDSSNEFLLPFHSSSVSKLSLSKYSFGHFLFLVFLLLFLWSDGEFFEPLFFLLCSSESELLIFSSLRNSSSLVFRSLLGPIHCSSSLILHCPRFGFMIFNESLPSFRSQTVANSLKWNYHRQIDPSLCTWSRRQSPGSQAYSAGPENVVPEQSCTCNYSISGFFFQQQNKTITFRIQTISISFNSSQFYLTFFNTLNH